MLQRLAIHLTLVFLFAFTQIGVATHEISHLADTATHSQQDKNTSAEQCSQCISYAKVANGLYIAAFMLPVINTAIKSTPINFIGIQSCFTTAYAARAPPQTISI